MRLWYSWGRGARNIFKKLWESCSLLQWYGEVKIPVNDTMEREESVLHET